jgi:hypothetical protein
MLQVGATGIKADEESRRLVRGSCVHQRETNLIMRNIL